MTTFLQINYRDVTRVAMGGGDEIPYEISTYEYHQLEHAKDVNEFIDHINMVQAGYSNKTLSFVANKSDARDISNLCGIAGEFYELKAPAYFEYKLKASGDLEIDCLHGSAIFKDATPREFAYARLFCAAPRMLEALKQIAEMHEGCPNSTDKIALQAIEGLEE